MGFGAVLGFFDQPVAGEFFDGSIEAARTEFEPAAGAVRNLALNGVAVALGMWPGTRGSRSGRWIVGGDLRERSVVSCGLLRMRMNVFLIALLGRGKTGREACLTQRYDSMEGRSTNS